MAVESAANDWFTGRLVESEGTTLDMYQIKTKGLDFEVGLQNSNDD